MDDFFCFSKNLGFRIFLVHPTVVSVLLSASVERCFVSRMRDFLVAYSEGEYLDHAEEGGEGVLGGADLKGHPGLGLADGVAPSLKVRHLGVGPKKPEQFKVRSSLSVLFNTAVCIALHEGVGLIVLCFTARGLREKDWLTFFFTVSSKQARKNRRPQQQQVKDAQLSDPLSLSSVKEGFQKIKCKKFFTGGSHWGGGGGKKRGPFTFFFL